MEEAASAGCGGLLQLARRGDCNRPGGNHRNSRVAVGLEEQKLKSMLLMRLVMGCLSSLLISVGVLIHRSVPKPLRPQSVDPATRQIDEAKIRKTGKR
jgi:hypothetical protein